VPKWSGAEQVVASVASFGNLYPVRGPTPHAVAPAAVATAPAALTSRPQIPHVVSAVALAPAAMAALIEAQEHEGPNAAPLARLRTVHRLDQLIASLDGAQTTLGSPASAQRLETARQRLAEMTTGA
jgi:hypothetical protein